MMHYYPPFSPFYRMYLPKPISEHESRFYSSRVGKTNPRRIYNSSSTTPNFSNEKNCYLQSSLCSGNTHSNIENVTVKEEKKENRARR